MADDWFRLTTWTEEDERGFRERLARARPENRAQYLAIQGHSLAGASPPLHAQVIALLTEMIRDFDAPIHRSDAWRQIGESRMALGDEAGAVQAYERGVDAMRAFPQVTTRAPIALALHIAERRIAERYNEALGLLDEFDKDTLFPVSRFERYACRALIFSAQRRDKEAAFQAGAALSAAGRDNSGLPRHPKLGIVGERHAGLVAWMRTIAHPRHSLWKRLTGRA